MPISHYILPRWTLLRHLKLLQGLFNIGHGSCPSAASATLLPPTLYFLVTTLPLSTKTLHFLFPLLRILFPPVPSWLTPSLTSLTSSSSLLQAVIMCALPLLPTECTCSCTGQWLNQHLCLPSHIFYSIDCVTFPVTSTLLDKSLLNECLP